MGRRDRMSDVLADVRARLRESTLGVGRTTVEEFEGEQTVGGFDWLDPLMSRTRAGLELRLVQRVQAHNQNLTLPARFFGATNTNYSRKSNPRVKRYRILYDIKNIVSNGSSGSNTLPFVVLVQLQN